jgi:hypothetical protein
MFDLLFSGSGTVRLMFRPIRLSRDIHVGITYAGLDRGYHLPTYSLLLRFTGGIDPFLCEKFAYLVAELFDELLNRTLKR